jgi:hypothetical protein
MVRRYPMQVLGKDCGYEHDQIKYLKEDNDGDDEQEAFELQTARIALRRYPSILVCTKMPEPWRSALAKSLEENSAKEELACCEDEE